MTSKILVAYASKTNAASEHAGAIAGTLKGAGRDVGIVDLRQTRKPDLGPYGSIIIGSGVRMGRWYGPARKLLKRKELAGKKVALFVACGMACDEKNRADAVGKLIAPVKERYGLTTVSDNAFPGKLPGARNQGLISTEKAIEWAGKLATLL